MGLITRSAIQPPLRETGASLGSGVPNKRATQVAIEAKFLRPRLEYVSLRSDVRAAFLAAFERKLTVVCAPAGYGKTTVTAATLEVSGRSAVWYKLDLLDCDPITLLAAMTRSVRRLHEDFGAVLLRELESGQLLDVPPEVLAAQFCAECDRHVHSPMHIILDDYHEAMDATETNDILGYLFENCPATISFAVLTRYEPAFRSEKLRLSGDAERISRDLLVFDAAQVADVLQQRSGKHHDRAFIDRLLTLTEGWPASIVLAGMSLAWLNEDSLEDALADPRLRFDVFSYLAEQVIHRLSDPVQQFLLRTCCLEAVSVGLAERLAAPGSAARHLHFLAHNQIFTFDAGRKGTYRYHNLLRSYLRQRYINEQGDKAFRSLQIETSIALESLDDRAAAIEILLAANEPDRAVGAIARGGETELERQPSEQLRSWAGQLAQSTNGGRPWGLTVSAVVDTREGRFPVALATLRRAVEALANEGKTTELYQVLSITEWAQFWAGDSEGSIRTCERALRHAETDAQRMHTLNSLVSAAVDLRRWDMVRETIERISEFLPRAHPQEATRTQALQAHAAFYQGDMYKAQLLIGGCHDDRLTVAQRAAFMNTHAMVELALAEFGSAARRLQIATEIADGFGHSLTAHIEDNIAYLDASVGGFDEARTRLAWLRAESDAVDPTGRCSLLTHQGTLARRSGDTAGGIPPTQEALEMLSPDRDPYLAYNARANLALMEGLLGADNHAVLEELSAKAAAAGVHFVELKAQLFMGILADIAGNSAEAITLLEACLPRQLALGHINLIAQELCPRPELLSRVVRRHRSNGLGPSLLEAVSRHWRFPEVAPQLKELGPIQVTTWIDHLRADRPAPPFAATRPTRPTPAGPSPHPSNGLQMAQLTKRELQVLSLMAQNRTNDEIAAELFVAVSTVKTHVNHILRKLGQSTRVGAILEYQRVKRLPTSLVGENPPWG